MDLMDGILQNNRLCNIVPPLLAWYRANKRDLPWRQDREAYHIWVSEIMLQQTRVEAVIPYYERFMARCPDVASLAVCDDAVLLKLWEGLGYYSRVKNMKKAAQMICSKNHGQFPQTYEEILKLPGVGAYTAGAVASIAFGQPVAAVDGNVLRVYTRLMQDSHDIMDTRFRGQVAEALTQIYPQQKCDRSLFNERAASACAVRACGDLTQSLMELGAVVCVPNGEPKCSICPLNQMCSAYQSGTQQQFPVKKKKAARKIQEKTVLLLEYQDKIALRKRGTEGLLSGMWELPNIDNHATMQEVCQWLEDEGIGIDKMIEPNRAKKVVKHIFTHIEWHMTYWTVICASVAGKNSFTWVTKEQLTKEIALASAFRKVYDLIEGGAS